MVVNLKICLQHQSSHSGLNCQVENWGTPDLIQLTSDGMQTFNGLTYCTVPCTVTFWAHFDLGFHQQPSLV